MLRSGRSRRAIVIVLIACLLRALLPIEGALSSDSQVPASGSRSPALSDFPCAGHRCGCHTREHCLSACCCFPARGNAAHASDRESPRGVELASFARAMPSTERVEHVAFLQALKCAGGAPRSLAAGYTILSTEPPEPVTLPLDAGAGVDARVTIGTLRGTRPSPSTPPPRANDARA
jgi:hypothetical protein